MVCKVVFLIFAAFPLVAWGKDYFTAAVFEHRPRHGGSTDPRETVNNNLKFFEKAAKLAVRKGADIVVFNEYGIFPYNKKDPRKYMRQFMENIPDPEKTQFNPCTEGREDMHILSTLSCMAKKNNVYIVANLGDMKPCDGTCSAEVQGCSQKCFEDGVHMYNTNVAFDRKGNLIARYHKMHLYFEKFDTPEDPEFVTFSTEFGKFGLFICFDAMWSSSMLLAQDYGIDTAIFSTFWFEEVLPFNIVEFQRSWTVANNVNFLAANTHVPGNGSLGSGIFSKDGDALVYTYEPDGESKLLVAKVPTGRHPESTQFSPEPSITVIQEHGSYLKEETGDAFPEYGSDKTEDSAFDIYKDYRMSRHLTENYTLARLEEVKGDIEVCSNGFCCKLHYTMEADAGEEYYFGAFNGLNNARGYFHWWEETCLLLRCDSVDGELCLKRPSRAKTVFQSVEISASFKSERVYPTVSLDRFRLAPKSEWKFDRKDSTAVLKFEPKTKNPLLKAGLLGRYYSKDPPFIPFYVL